MKKTIRLMLMLSIITLLAAPNTYAASTKQKAIKAYQKFLAQSKVMVLPENTIIFIEDRYKGTASSKAKFATAYLDKDKVPELFVYDSSAGYAVFGYKNGKVVRAGYEAMHAKPKGYYKGTGIYLIKSNIEGYIFSATFNRYAGGKSSYALLHEYMLDDEGTGTQDHKYYKSASGRSQKENKISKDVFNTLLANYTGGKSITYLKLENNTSANRKKYLR